MAPAAHASGSFVLIDETTAPRVAAGRSAKVPAALEIPPGSWSLQCDPAGEPLRLAGSGERGAVLVESLRNGCERVLLLAATTGDPVRVNGARAAVLACLRDRDAVQLPGGRSARVALVLRSTVGAAPPGYSDRTCPVCHQPIGASSIWICPSCDAAVHCESEAGSGCLLGSECPACRGPLGRDAEAAPAGEDAP
jgi:hypothetical protein